MHHALKHLGMQDGAAGHDKHEAAAEPQPQHSDWAGLSSKQQTAAPLHPQYLGIQGGPVGLLAGASGAPAAALLA